MPVQAPDILGGMQRGLALRGEMLRQQAVQQQLGQQQQLQPLRLQQQQAATGLQQAEYERFMDKANMQSMAKAAYEFLQIKDPAQQQAYLEKRYSNLLTQGRDARDTGEMLDMPPEQRQVAAQNVLDLYKWQTQGAGTEVAGIKEFDYLAKGLTEDERARARRIKLGLSPRATESATEKAEKAFLVESGKLQAKYNLEPKVAGAVTAAKNEATARVKEAGTEKSNTIAWDVYNSSMSNLATAMKGTETGPIVGFIPAMTANQQIADGAVAVMAPVLKQMFRSAGEGTFTDKDQELLLGMVPTRKDLPAARIAKIKAIDSVVRAKLGITTEAPAPAAGQTQTKTKTKYTEGMIAKGPGGKRLIYKNGKWRPL